MCYNDDGGPSSKTYCVAFGLPNTCNNGRLGQYAQAIQRCINQALASNRMDGQSRLNQDDIDGIRILPRYFRRLVDIISLIWPWVMSWVEVTEIYLTWFNLLRDELQQLEATIPSLASSSS